MLYENLVSAAFAQKVKTIAGDLSINPDWLMMVMYNESRFNPAATNSIGAVGLIQFIPSTYQGWGYSKAQMQAMSALDQLDLVKRFYWSKRGQFKSYPDLHLHAFFPAAIGKPDNWVIQSEKLSAETIVTHNPGFDLNGDKQITVGEYKQRVYDRTIERVGKEMADELFNSKKKSVHGLGLSLVWFVLFYYGFYIDTEFLKQYAGYLKGKSNRHKRLDFSPSLLILYKGYGLKIRKRKKRRFAKR